MVFYTFIFTELLVLQRFSVGRNTIVSLNHENGNISYIYNINESLLKIIKDEFKHLHCNQMYFLSSEHTIIIRIKYASKHGIRHNFVQLLEHGVYYTNIVKRRLR